MRHAKFISLALALLILTPALSSAGVKVTLKNGRTVYANWCKETGGKLFCDVAGGTFEIDRKDIVGMMDTTSQASEPASLQEPAAAAGEKQPKPVLKQGEVTIVRGLTPEQIKRLDQINERKAVLQPERDKLIKERDQLHEDVKNMGVVRYQSQIDSVKQRIADIEARIIAFNDEVKKLNEEESRLLTGSPLK
jgi:hypothetical protein